MRASHDFLTFFPISTLEAPTELLFTQNGSNNADARKDVPFAETNATFHTHSTPGPLKGHTLENFWTLKIFATRL